MMTKRRTVIASLFAAVVLSLSGFGAAQAYSEPITDAQYYNEEYWNDQLSWQADDHKYYIERIEMVHQAWEKGIIGDDDYFYDLMDLWYVEKNIQMTLSDHDLGKIDTENSRYLKNVVESPESERLIDALFASK